MRDLCLKRSATSLLVVASKHQQGGNGRTCSLARHFPVDLLARRVNNLRTMQSAECMADRVQSAECRILHLHVLHLSHLSSLLRILQLYKNDRLSVSSTEHSAIESHPQTVSQYSSFSEMTTENTDRDSVNACQDTDTLVQPCLARSSPYSCTA